MAPILSRGRSPGSARAIAEGSSAEADCPTRDCRGRSRRRGRLGHRGPGFRLGRPLRAHGVGLPDHAPADGSGTAGGHVSRLTPSLRTRMGLMTIYAVTYRYSDDVA